MPEAVRGLWRALSMRITRYRMPKKLIYEKAEEVKKEKFAQSLATTFSFFTSSGALKINFFYYAVGEKAGEFFSRSFFIEKNTCCE